MPATSPEAIARKVQRKNEKNRREAAKKRAALALKQNLMLPSHKITARRMRSPIGPLSKSELRAMLAEACANTAALSC